MSQGRANAAGAKSHRMGQMVGRQEDSDRFLSRCQSGYQNSSSRSPYIDSDTEASLNASPGLRHQEDCASSSSSSFALDRPRILASLQNVVVPSSDESESELDIDAGSKFVSDSNGLLNASDWNSPSVSSPFDELDENKDDALSTECGYSNKRKGVSNHPLKWQDLSKVQPPRLRDSMAKGIVDECPRRVSTAYQNQRAYRKGSSSKAPQTNDLTAPLLLEKKSISMAYTALQGEREDQDFTSASSLGLKAKNPTCRQSSNSANSRLEGSYDRRKSNSDNFRGHYPKSEEIGAGRKNMNSNGAGFGRRGLTNLVCASAADVLPSVSSSTLSNLACSSAVDVLPPVPGTISGYGYGYLRSRRSSRIVGSEGETSKRLQPLKRQVEESDSLSMREIHNEADQVPYGSSQGVSLSRRAPHSDPSQAESSRTDSLSCENPIPLLISPSPLPPPPLPPPNHRQWRRNVAFSRSGDVLQSLYRSTAGEELSNEWRSRRRSLYGSHTDRLCPDIRSPSRNYSHERHSRNSWSVLREMHSLQSRFPEPPARSPPLPPVAGFAEPSPSENGFNPSAPASSADHSSSSRPSAFVLPSLINTEQPSSVATGSLNPAISNVDGCPQLTVEGLSEILSTLEYIERDEDLSYEQILMLEATVLLGGIGLPDRYRDMRIDIDNMSYEELLALEERIGNVNTGLSEESLSKTIRVETFTSPKVTHDYVLQEIQIKCSICQEEFEESVELGVLDCGHSHHIACIKQWLLQKNQCPVCKAPAIP